jgi:hypothetical protein
MDKKRLHDDAASDPSSVSKKSRRLDGNLSDEIIDIKVDFFYIW